MKNILFSFNSVKNLIIRICILIAVSLFTSMKINLMAVGI